ncbi:MAG: zinc-ribbon domain-containing protein, partial [Deltaproteobacteria bacterium]
MKCPYCGAEHPENARFCPVTGQTLLKSQERVCPVCGVAVQADWPYCQACGAPLQKHKIPYPYLASMVAGVLSILLGAYFTWGYFHTLAETADTLRSSAWRDAGRISLKESPDLLLYSPDGAMLASVQGERISVYTTSDMRLVTRLKADATVRSLQFSPSGDLLAAGLETGHVELWRLPEGVLLRTIAWNSAAVLTVDFSSDG